VLGAALGEGDEANAAAPASEPGVAGEELVEFGVSDAAEALEIGVVERFIRAAWIACQLEAPPRRRTVRPVAGESSARFTCRFGGRAVFTEFQERLSGPPGRRPRSGWLATATGSGGTALDLRSWGDREGTQTRPSGTTM
jgi:hypothetical protein